MSEFEVSIRNFSRGLSTIEVLIVMAIAMPVVMAFMGAYNSFFHSQSRSMDVDLLQSSTSRIVHDITQEIHAADAVEIIAEGPSDRVIVTSSGSDKDHTQTRIEYKVINGKLYKNNAQISEERLVMHSFNVKNVAKQGGVPLLNWTLSMGSIRNPQTQLAQQFAISLRQNSIGKNPTPNEDRLNF